MSNYNTLNLEYGRHSHQNRCCLQSKYDITIQWRQGIVTTYLTNIFRTCPPIHYHLTS